MRHQRSLLARTDDAINAILCASSIAKAIRSWNIERQRMNKAPVAFGIGAHWGKVYCGAVGDQERLEFTVLGDTVNIASRLESLTKEVGCQIVVSQALLLEAGLSGAELERWVPMPESSIRGRTGRIDLYRYRS